MKLIKALDRTCQKIGETVTVQENISIYGENDIRFDVLIGMKLTVVGYENVSDFDDHGAILDGVFYVPSNDQAQVFYQVRVFRMSDGVAVTARISPLEVEEQRNDVKWLYSIEDYTLAARRAFKNGQTELAEALTRYIRILTIMPKLKIRRERENKRLRARRELQLMDVTNG